MEQEYDDAYTDAADPPAESKSHIYQSLSKSKSSLIIINLLVISLVISVVSLICTFVLVNEEQNKFEEKFTLMEATIADLRNEVGIMKSREILEQSLAQVSTEFHTSLNKTQQDLLDIMESQQKLEESLQSLSKEVSAELSVTVQGTQQDLQNLSNQVTSYHQITAVVTCPPGYRRNPYANSCIRQVTVSKSWNDARIYCNRSGERLATFETLESQYWFINLRKTTWTTEHVWIGGDRPSSSGWRWNSDSSKPIDIVVWGTEEPTDDGSENCLESLNTKEYKFNDETCDSTYWFVCENFG